MRRSVMAVDHDEQSRLELSKLLHPSSGLRWQVRLAPLPGSEGDGEEGSGGAVPAAVVELAPSGRPTTPSGR